MRYDVVVVGAGPSGATCARVLSQRGARVLLVEKKKLPRFKLCAGCLSARIEKLLPEGWEREVLNTIKGGYLGFRGEEFYHRNHPEGVAYIIDRSSFDYFLTRSAVSRGAELWEETEFLGFEEGRTLRVRTSRGIVETDFLVGADGFYTKVGKALGYKKEHFFRSVEFWTTGELREEVVIDVGVVRRGYGWIFPKGGRLSVGLATAGKENTLEVLRSYVDGHTLLKEKSVKGVRGWMIPFARNQRELHLGKGRVMLVGDSANMVDPLLGEGIYYGVLGGYLLADAVISCPSRALESYREAVYTHILPELEYAGKIARLSYTFQRVAFRMGGGFTIDRFLRLLRGETSYKELYRKGLPDFIKSLLHFENFSHIIIDKILRRR